MKKGIAVLISAMLFALPICGEVTKASNQNNISQAEMNFLNGITSIRAQINFVTYKDSIWAQYGKPNIIRKLKNNFSYEIRNIKDGSKLFVFYLPGYNNKEPMSDIWRLNKLLKPEDFKQIKVGKSNSADVKKIDPYCGIMNMDMSGKKAMSETRLKDNKSMVIEYIKKGKLWIVSKMKCEKTVLQSFSKLIPEDLAEISK